MNWDQIFSTANAVALLAWLVLILAPRRPMIAKTLFFGPVFLLALGYAVALISLLSGVISADGGGGANFSTISGVRGLFGSDAGVTIGWVHYLAFDLFVGIWIARNADALGLNGLKGRFIQAPILFLTFMAGPLGLALYLIIRNFVTKPSDYNALPA